MYIQHIRKNNNYKDRSIKVHFLKQFDAFFKLGCFAICMLHGRELVLQKQALPKLKPKSSSLATKSSRGNQSGSPDRVKSVLELLSCRGRPKLKL